MVNLAKAEAQEHQTNTNLPNREEKSDFIYAISWKNNMRNPTRCYKQPVANYASPKLLSRRIQDLTRHLNSLQMEMDSRASDTCKQNSSTIHDPFCPPSLPNL